MSGFTLTVSPRDLTKEKPKHLREKNIVPGVIYGPTSTPENVQVDLKTLKTFLKAYDHTTLINLALGDKSAKVLIRNIQIHPVSDELQNIEFFAPDLTKTITVDVPIRLTGESSAVKIDKGILFQNLEMFKIRCLPEKTISHITLDISVLKNFDKAIFVRDVPLPSGVEAALPADELVIKVLKPKVEEVDTSAQSAAPPADAKSTPAADAKKDAKK